eukprot:4210110-Prymnesium_polylepis.1
MPAASAALPACTATTVQLDPSRNPAFGDAVVTKWSAISAVLVMGSGEAGGVGVRRRADGGVASGATARPTGEGVSTAVVIGVETPSP